MIKKDKKNRGLWLRVRKAKKITDEDKSIIKHIVLLKFKFVTNRLKNWVAVKV